MIRLFKRQISTKPFDKILIANRGEIACRVIRTAHKLGVRTVAVHSEIDSKAMHAQLADEAYMLGPAPSSESYLRMDKVIEIAKKSGAQAIHPGYGFLSENPVFAQKVQDAGLVFVGPPASAIIAMGSKSASKKIMMDANVPVVPGYHGTNQDPEFLKQQANEIGYPVLIKAVKGGGGKGMRIVHKEDEFHDMLTSSKREAVKSFGDDRVLVEKYLTKPRHVEVQVFCDTHGNAVYLFERDCSVQRRHQKIIEEAPAPFLSADIRRELGEKAVAAAKAVNYVGAGTVEFIMDADTQKFYFMEMNTRLQVEHPVTEMVTGTDLVAWQLHVAAGNKLPLMQNELECKGHSFEARIYAENPYNNFLPDTGNLVYLQTPQPREDVRVETGVRQGDPVSVYYDPMITKLVVWAETRDLALSKLAKELKEYKVVGCKTNIEFLLKLIDHKAFIEGDLHTGFIQKYPDVLEKPEMTAEQVFISAAAYLSGQVGFRVNLDYSTTVKFGDKEVKCHLNGNKWQMKFNGEEAQVMNEGGFVLINDKTLPVHVVEQDNQLHFFKPARWSVKLNELNVKKEAVEGDVVAPMPSKIAQVLVKPGDAVKKGQVLVVLEAMKMEHLIRAPEDGVVEKLKVVNDLVQEGEVIVTFQ